MTEHQHRTPSLKTTAENDGRSLVYLWLKRRHRHVLSTLSTGTAQQPWQTIAREMGAQGVRTKIGEPPKADGVRKTWLRLERDRADKARAKETKAEKRPRSYRPSVEPPSRPGDNRPVPKPPGTYAEQTDGRERQVHQDAPSASSTASDTALPVAPALPNTTPSNGGRLTPAEIMANLERQFRKIDGPRQQPIVRGKII